MFDTSLLLLEKTYQTWSISFSYVVVSLQTIKHPPRLYFKLSSVVCQHF